VKGEFTMKIEYEKAMDNIETGKHKLYELLADSIYSNAKSTSDICDKIKEDIECGTLSREEAFLLFTSAVNGLRTILTRFDKIISKIE
jgi:hypothetical protein